MTLDELQKRALATLEEYEKWYNTRRGSGGRYEKAEDVATVMKYWVRIAVNPIEEDLIQIIEELENLNGKALMTKLES